MLIGQHLKLDVPRMLDILLHVEIAVAEGARRLDCAALNKPGSSSSLRTMRMPRPPPPAEAFMITGKPTCRAHSRLRPRWQEFHPTRQNRHARPFHGAGFFFFAHQPRHFRRRPDELDTAGLVTSAKFAFSASNP
jgi:hypothetical protein